MCDERGVGKLPQSGTMGATAKNEAQAGLGWAPVEVQDVGYKCACGSPAALGKRSAA